MRTGVIHIAGLMNLKRKFYEIFKTDIGQLKQQILDRSCKQIYVKFRLSSINLNDETTLTYDIGVEITT